MSHTTASAAEPGPAPLAWALPSERPDPRSILTVDPQVTAWIAHVEAGRIGAAPAPDPAVAASRDAAARLFARPKGRW